MNRDDVPERGVHGVVLGLVTFIRKAVGKHPLGNGPGPFDQDLPGLLQTSGRQAQAPQGDERVASPLGEPGISGDDRLPAAPADDVVLGGARERRGEAQTAAFLHGPKMPGERQGALLALGRLRREQHHGLSARELKTEDAGRGQVLDRVESSSALLGIEEVAVPERLVRVRPVGGHADRWHASIGNPHPAIASPVGLEAEGRVLVVEGVVIAAREEEPN